MRSRCTTQYRAAVSVFAASRCDDVRSESAQLQCAPSLMSGARRLLKLKRPITFVAHSRLYSSSVISVVMTCSHAARPHCTSHLTPWHIVFHHCQRAHTTAEFVNGDAGGTAI